MDDSGETILDLLGRSMPGSRLTSLLLEVMRRRANGLTATDVRRRFNDDRFVMTSPVSTEAVRKVRAAIVESLPKGTLQRELSPLVPLGSHRAIAGVDQYRVVSTVRGTEVAADPTVGLALEAAQLRRGFLAEDARSDAHVSLATFQRVVRGQTFEGPMSFPHFELSGLVTAGRDRGGRLFEIGAIGAHVNHMVKALHRLEAEEIVVRLADFTDGDLAAATESIRGSWSHDDAVSIEDDSGRTRARGYYIDAALSIDVVLGGERFEVGDGGLVDWSQRLVASKKERMMTSGLSVERLAIAIG